MKTLLPIYYGIFHSVANYGIITWGRAGNADFEKFLKIQERILKLIYGNIELSDQSTSAKLLIKLLQAFRITYILLQ